MRKKNTEKRREGRAWREFMDQIAAADEQMLLLEESSSDPSDGAEEGEDGGAGQGGRATNKMPRLQVLALGVMCPDP